MNFQRCGTGRNHTEQGRKFHCCVVTGAILPCLNAHCQSSVSTKSVNYLHVRTTSWLQLQTNKQMSVQCPVGQYTMLVCYREVYVYMWRRKERERERERERETETEGEGA